MLKDDFILGLFFLKNFFVLTSQVNSYQVELAIYGPMIYTAPYAMLLMRANPLRGQVGGGWAQGWANLDQAHEDLDRNIFRDLSPTPKP